MNMQETAKKFLRKSSLLEKMALHVYETIPYDIRNRMLLGPAFVRWTMLLKESESWDKDRVFSYQLEQTKTLLIHAVKNVPYYRKLFCRLGFRPERIQSPDDLIKLPCLSKDDIRDNPTEFLDERIPLKSLTRISTGGSSGIPLTIYRNRENEAAFLAFRRSILGRIGHSPKAREVMLWPDIRVGRKSVPFMHYGNRLVLSVRYFAGEWLLKYLTMIREFKPEYLLGYSSALALIANVMKQNNLSRYENIQAVIPYSETLYDWQRKLMEEIFGSRVFSMYAMTERAAIGSECETSTDMHFHPLYGITEFEEYIHGYEEIAVTGFTNYEMPLIRYKTGDLVSEHSAFCHACGRMHITAGTIEGRTHEFLVGKKGELIPSLSSWIGIFQNVLQYQFFQNKPGIVCLNIVPSKTFSKSDNDHILSDLDRIFGQMKDAIKIELNFVDHIPGTSAGKAKMMEQRLDIYSLVASKL